MKTLVYSGGSTLTFGSGRARRTVKRDEPFEVDDDLGKVLLRDRHVNAYEPPEPVEVPRGTAATASSDGDVTPAPTKAQLLERASALGLELSKRATNDAITAAIAAEEQRLADEAAATAATASSDGEGDQGGSTPADDPDAVATGEAGTPPAETTGAITLGDLPEGGKVQRS